MPNKKAATKKPARQSGQQSSPKNKKRPDSPTTPVSNISTTPEFLELLPELVSAIRERKYDEAERIGNELIDLSPSEEVDRCLNDIITSANTISDAEDEIRYQLEDLKTALSETAPLDSSFESSEVDGL